MSGLYRETSLPKLARDYALHRGYYGSPGGIRNQHGTVVARSWGKFLTYLFTTGVVDWFKAPNETIYFIA